MSTSSLIPVRVYKEENCEGKKKKEKQNKQFKDVYKEFTHQITLPYDRQRPKSLCNSGECQSLFSDLHEVSEKLYSDPCFFSSFIYYLRSLPP